jgi:hypothetical protein
MMGDMSICWSDKLRCPTPEGCRFVCQRERARVERGGFVEVKVPPGHSIAECAPVAIDSRNPKDIAGQSKPQLHLIPSPALIEVAKVMGLGAAKYGPYNWREKAVCHTAYISAAERHARSHLDGELFDPDAKAHVYHLASAAAGLLILLDAILTGNAIDDRPKAGVAGALINPPKEARQGAELATYKWRDSSTGKVHTDTIIPRGRT